MNRCLIFSLAFFMTPEYPGHSAAQDANQAGKMETAEVVIGPNRRVPAVRYRARLFCRAQRDG